MAKREARGHVVRLRVDEEERVRIERVAAHYGLDVSALVRMLVKQEYDSVLSENKR